MDQIHRFLGGSNKTVQQEFLRNLKVRSVEQKFLYFGEGADIFYRIPNAYTQNAEDIQPEFLAKEIEESFSKDEKIAFISLCCGSAMRDRDFLRLLHARGFDFHLIGVDSSETMIDMAEKTLEGEEFSYEFWIEDINAHSFYQRAHEEVKKYEKVVFMFLGRTIGNMVQTEIVDTLYNLTDSGHYLWFDCLIRETKHKSSDLELFQRYTKRLHGKAELECMFYPLQVLGVPMDAGIMMLENIFEESIGVMNFRYSFRFTRPYTVNCMNEYVHFLPPEKIKLLDIRIYHLESTIKYFEQHDFHLCKSFASGRYGQLMLQKN